MLNKKNILILSLVEYMGGWKEILSSLQLVNPYYIFLAFLIATIDRLLMAFKWRKLLIYKSPHKISFFQSVKIYCTSQIWGIFLPSTVGADAIRIYLTRKIYQNTHKLVSSVFIERVVGFITSNIYAILGLFILFVYQSSAIENMFNNLLIVCVSMLIISLLLFYLSFKEKTIVILENILSKSQKTIKIQIMLRKLHDSYRDFQQQKRSMFIFFVLTIIEQLDASLLFILGVIPLANLVARLPISIDGIGVFEGIFILLMSLAGISAAHAFTIAFLGRIIQILSWAPWWFL